MPLGLKWGWAVSTRPQFSNTPRSFRTLGWILSGPRDLLLFISSTGSKTSSVYTFVWDTSSNFFSFQKDSSVVMSLCTLRMNINAKKNLWFFSLLKLYFHRAALLHLHHLSVLQTLWQTSCFLMRLKMTLLSVFMPLASCSSKPFLAHQWFYIYGFAFNLLVFRLERILDKLNAKIIHGNRRTGSD